MRYYESEAVGARVVILSEYAISRVDRPVYLNRVLRAEGLVQVRTENGGETLDCGECRAFALCDHQVCVSVDERQPQPVWSCSISHKSASGSDALMTTFMYARNETKHMPGRKKRNERQKPWDQERRDFWNTA